MRDLRLLDQVREKIRLKHYSYRTEQAYTAWIKRYVHFHTLTHPQDLGDDAIEEFLSHLATRRHVSASTQNQALAALLFLYHHVLGRDPEQLTFTRARRTRRLPVVLDRNDVRAILNALRGKYKLMGYLLYGSGLRQRECLALRVKDVDPDYGQVIVRDGKGSKDRVTMFPKTATQRFERQLLHALTVLDSDITLGLPGVSLPAALARKFPNARLDWAWQYVFPSSRYSKEPRTGRTFRHHAYPSSLEKAVKKATREAGIAKKVTCHTFRHSFATHLL